MYFQHFEETLEIVHSGLVSACRRFQRIKQRSLQLTDITHKLDKESPNHLSKLLLKIGYLRKRIP
jgi:hypothetical protein